ncbi:MAG: amidohydrolase family protein, partial [Candidatus Binatia bacterium]
MSAAGDTLLIRDVRLIDGRGGEPRSDVSILIENEIFREIREGSIPAPAGARVIDAGGKTALPGLVDMHAHLASGGFDTIGEDFLTYEIGPQKRVLEQMLYWGVTSVCNPVQPLPEGLRLRRESEEVPPTAPRLFVSGPGFTAAGGWAGTKDPTARLEPREPAAARRHVAQLAEAKVDFVKVFYDDMDSAFAGSLPRAEESILTAIVEEAHRFGLRVMVHTYDFERAAEAVRTGTDVLAHSVVTAAVDEDFLEAARRNDLLYLATLSVYHDVFDEEAIRRLAAEDFVRKTVPRRTLETLAPGGPLDAFERMIKQSYIKGQLATIDDNLRRVAAAGIAVGVGPDSGVYGSFPGISVHREMELMVQAGLTPGCVLRAATAVGPKYLGRDDIGSVEAGKAADLVIVAGD